MWRAQVGDLTLAGFPQEWSGRVLKSAFIHFFFVFIQLRLNEFQGLALITLSAINILGLLLLN